MAPRYFSSIVSIKLLNTNTEIIKGPHTTGRTYGQTYYTDTQGILTHGLQPHALCVIKSHAFMIAKIDTDN